MQKHKVDVGGSFWIQVHTIEQFLPPRIENMMVKAGNLSLPPLAVFARRQGQLYWAEFPQFIPTSLRTHNISNNGRENFHFLQSVETSFRYNITKTQQKYS